MGRKNAEMGKAHFSVLKMGKVRRLLKVSFFTPILGEDYKNVVFPRCVVKDICQYSLPDTFKTPSPAVEHFRVFF